MPRSTSTYNTKRYNCLHCSRSFSTQGGLTKHRKSTHKPAQFLPPSTSESARDLPSASASQHPEGPFENVQEHGGDLDGAVPPVVESSQYHPFLNGTSTTSILTFKPIAKVLFTPAIRCDQDGHPVPKNAPPGPSNADDKDWKPFQNRVELGEFLYKEEQMSQRKINKLLELWAASLVEHGATPPYTSQQQMYDTIDAITVGDVPWETFSLKYSGEVPDGVTPSWMLANYEIHFRDPHLLARQQLNNPAFKDGFDPIPRRDFDCKGDRLYSDFMSGSWSWKQADTLAQDPTNHGAMVLPLIFGSDKTTVSVATGQNDYYPLYMSSGVITNAYRRAHCDSVVPIAFLATPKCI